MSCCHEAGIVDHAPTATVKALTDDVGPMPLPATDNRTATTVKLRPRALPLDAFLRGAAQALRQGDESHGEHEGGDPGDSVRPAVTLTDLAQDATGGALAHEARAS